MCDLVTPHINERFCAIANVWARGKGPEARGEDFPLKARLFPLATSLAPLAPSLTLPHNMGEGWVGDDEPS